MYVLNNEDQEDINILIGLGQSILETEEKLSVLEQEGRKSEKQYNTALEWLHSTLLLEQNVYRRIGTDPEKIKAIISKLTSTPDKDIQLKNITQNIVSFNHPEMIKNRILNKLNIISINNNKDEINAQAQIIGLNKDTNKSTVIKVHSILATNQAIVNDIVGAIMLVLNTEINNIDNPKNTRDYLIRIKYYFSFVFETIEKDLLNNNFEISNELYLTSQALAEYYGLDLNIYKASQLSLAQEQVLSSLGYINNVPNSDFNNKNVMTIIKIHEILMRSGLILVTEETKNKINEVIMRNIQIKLREYNRRDICDQFIIKIIKKSEEDKTNCKHLSLCLKKES